MTRFLPLLILLGACRSVPDEVRISGTVAKQRLSFEPLAGADVVLRNDRGKQFSSGRTDADGAFAVKAPAGRNVFLDIQGPGTERVTFPGIAGISPHEVDPGLLFGVTADEIREVEEQYAGCPEIGTGGLVYGDVQVQGIEDQNDISLFVRSARVAVITDDGDIYEACYLDRRGEAYSAKAKTTGVTGRFAIFGVPDGVHTLEVSYFFALQPYSAQYLVYIPEAGSVSPRFPLWVELVLANDF